MLGDELEALRDEEQDAFDNMPESLQMSERGEGMEDAIALLDDVYSAIDDGATRLEELAE